MDGRAGRVSWASYAAGESYLVITTGLLRRTHRVLPAGAVTSVRDGGVFVAMSCAEIARLPFLSHPQAAVGDDAREHMLKVSKRMASWGTI